MRSGCGGLRGGFMHDDQQTPPAPVARGAERGVAAQPHRPECESLTPGPLTLTQWMYGPDFLVGPVLQQGATSRSVYLPSIAPATWTWEGML